MKEVEIISARVRKELILLHKEGVEHPQGTVQWLNALGWISSYSHVMMDGWINRQMDGWMDGWINRQMDGRMIEHQF